MLPAPQPGRPRPSRPRVLAGRPAILHHHDLPWQRPQFLQAPPPPVDPRWRHVTINQLSRVQLADRGIAATTIYNAFDLDGPRPGPGSRPAAWPRRRQLRRAVGVDDDDRLVLQPTRAIPRKNVAGGCSWPPALDAVYWLLGPAEDGYGPELAEALVAGADVSGGPGRPRRAPP